MKLMHRTPVLNTRPLVSFQSATMAAASLSSPLSLLRISRLVRPYAIPTIINGFSSSRPIIRPQTQRFVRHMTASVNEETAAKSAADTGSPTIYDKIIAKEIPSDIVYEDEKVLAFRDINPQAPVHILIIPKFRDGLTQLGKAESRHSEILGRLLYISKIVAEKEGIGENFRLVINSGPEACQSVYHLHLHILGGRQMSWPPG